MPVCGSPVDIEGANFPNMPYCLSLVRRAASKSHFATMAFFVKCDYHSKENQESFFYENFVDFTCSHYQLLTNRCLVEVTVVHSINLAAGHQVIL